MPALNVDQLRKKEAAIRAKLAEKADSLEPAQQRGMRKKLRRAQRKRRAAVVSAARNAPKPKEAAGDAVPAVVETTPAAETKEE